MDTHRSSEHGNARPARALVPIALLPILGVALFLGLQSISSADEREQETQRVLLEMRAHANRLDSLEWQVINPEARTPGVSTDITEVRRRVASAISRLQDLNFAGTARIRGLFSDYSEALDDELAAIAMGDTAGATALDEQRVDPAFDRLQESLTSGSDRAASAARHTDGLRAVATAGMIFSTFLVLGLLLWLFYRARLAANLGEAKQRVMREVHEERRRLLERTVLAREDERSRVAVTLHNGPVQRLTALDFMLERLRLELGVADPAAGDLVSRVQEELRGQIGALRGLMAELRPPALDERGLTAALGDLVGSLASEAGIDCRFRCELDERLDPDVETVVYRVVQEALTNISKHARAERAWIELDRIDGGISIEVRDDGDGFHRDGIRPSEGGGSLGLASIRERIEMVGGTLELTSAPGSGTLIRGKIPFALLDEEVSV